MYEALKVANEVFFFDADSILLRNPWIDIQFGRDEEGVRTAKLFDVQFQRDRGKGPACTGSANTGQVYVRNTTETQAYLNNMRTWKPLILKGGMGLDQDFVGNATKFANAKTCTLSTSLYAAHCFGSRNGRALAKDLVSYHTSCVEGIHSKKSRLNAVAHAVKTRPGCTLDQVA